MTSSMEASKSPPDSTADAEEIARFAAIADTWWDATGKFRPLHKLNPTRIEFIRDHVASHFYRDITADRPFEGLTFLDVGCGGGLLCEPLCRLGGTITGIDAAEESLAVARHHAEQGGLDINYRPALPEEILKEGGQFDVIINMEVVEHVTDMNIFLDICGRLVKPGGVIGAGENNAPHLAAACRFVQAVQTDDVGLQDGVPRRIDIGIAGHMNDRIHAVDRLFHTLQITGRTLDDLLPEIVFQRRAVVHQAQVVAIA